MQKYKKTIEINGQSIPVNLNSNTFVIYRGAFGREMSEDIRLTTLNGTSVYSMLVIYPQIIWVLAKTANPSLPALTNWYKQLGSFDCLKVCEGLVEMFEDVGGDVHV